MATPGGPFARSPGVFTPAFAALFLASFVTSAGMQLLTASLPLYAVTLGADDAVLGLLAGVIATISLLSRPLVGWWVDRGSLIPVLAAGMVTYILSALGYWVAASVTALLVARTFTGAGVALFTTGGHAMTVNLAPAARRGEALSLYTVTHPIAQILAPPAGVVVARALGYPWLFALCVAIHLIGLALLWPLRSLRGAVRPPRRLQVIHRSVLLPGVWLMALNVPYGASIGLLAVHAVRRGLGNPGVAFTAMAIGLLAVLLTAGRISDRVGRRAVIIPGLALSAVGMWLTAALHGWALVVAGVSTGFGFGLAQPALFAFGIDLVPEDERGSALGTMGVFLEIGVGVGAIGAGVLARSLGTGVMFGLAGVAPALGAVMAACTPRVDASGRWLSQRRAGS